MSAQKPTASEAIWYVALTAWSAFAFWAFSLSYSTAFFQYDLASRLPPFIAASYNGQDPYKDKHADMRLVMNGLGFVHIQVGVPDDYPAKTVRHVFELA